MQNSMSSLQSPANPLCLPRSTDYDSHKPTSQSSSPLMAQSSIPCPGPSHSQHSPLFFHHSPINPLCLKNSLT